MATMDSTQLIKDLRERTGAGMMDCKRALEETKGDMDAAIVLLREKGMANAAKRADRATTEGKVGHRLADDGSKGTMVAIGCETEPVSNNDEFLAYAKAVLDAVEAGGVGAESALEEQRVELSSKLGENIALVGGARFEAVDGARISAYAHPPANKFGALVHLRGGDDELGRKLGLQIVSLRPRWIGREDVPGRRRHGGARDLRALRRGAVEARAGAREDRRGHARTSASTASASSSSRSGSTTPPRPSGSRAQRGRRRGARDQALRALSGVNATRRPRPAQPCAAARGARSSASS